MNRQVGPTSWDKLPEPDKSKDFNDFDAQDEREATERDEDEFGMGRGW